MASLFLRWSAGWVRGLLVVAAAGWLAGCASSREEGSSGSGVAGTTGTAAGLDKLNKGDAVTIVFTGIPNPPAEQEERIKEDGTINLQLVGSIHAEGKTPGDLQRELQDAYVPKFFRRLTVTVKTENRCFYVDGEVRQPGRLVYTQQITALRAIAAAGGFNDFAARTRVELVRANGETLKVDAKKARDNPKLDPPIFPGDRILVPRRSPFGK